MNKIKMAIVCVCILSLSFVASAGIVNYLSNKVSDTVTVSSPIEVNVCNHPGFSTSYGDWTGWDGEISDDGLFVAGSEGMFWGKADNNANIGIDGTVRLTLTCWNGISSNMGEEFTTLTIEDFVDTTDSPVDLKTLGTMSLEDTNGEPGYDHLYIDVAFTDFPASTTEIYELYFVMDTHVLGTYTISFQII